MRSIERLFARMCDVAVHDRGRRVCGRGGVAVRVRGGHVVASWLCLWCRTGCRAVLCCAVA